MNASGRRGTSSRTWPAEERDLALATVLWRADRPIRLARAPHPQVVTVNVIPLQGVKLSGADPRPRRKLDRARNSGRSRRAPRKRRAGADTRRALVDGSPRSSGYRETEIREGIRLDDAYVARVLIHRPDDFERFRGTPAPTFAPTAARPHLGALGRTPRRSAGRPAHRAAALRAQAAATPPTSAPRSWRKSRRSAEPQAGRDTAAPLQALVGASPSTEAQARARAWSTTAPAEQPSPQRPPQLEDPHLVLGAHPPDRVVNDLLGGGGGWHDVRAPHRPRARSRRRRR